VPQFPSVTTHNISAGNIISGIQQVNGTRMQQDVHATTPPLIVFNNNVYVNTSLLGNFPTYLVMPSGQGDIQAMDPNEP